MNIIRKSLLLIIFLYLQPGISQDTKIRDDAMIYLKSNLEFLASDLLEGRETGTRGTKLASSFIVSELKKYRVKPFGDNGTYYQNFQLLSQRFSKKSKISIIDKNRKSNDFLIGEDFYISALRIPSIKCCADEKELVFAGYGISEDGYSDYKDIDVAGKIVLLLQEAPINIEETKFTPEEIELFSSEEYKSETAAKLGAAGIFLLPTESTTTYWEIIKKKTLAETINIFKEDNYEFNLGNNSLPVIGLSDKSAEVLLQNEKYNYGRIINEVDDGRNLSSFKLNKEVIIDYEYEVNVLNARNVIGIIEGTDDEIKDQYVTFSAHYDHEGIVKGKIYNGADDNGSGTVAILEAARRLSLYNKNKRSILVVFHTGEEKGLLGSKYLTENSLFMKDIVANINVDMVGREDTDHIHCIGSDKLSTELFILVEEVNNETAQFNLDYTFNDPFDPNKYYYRSDHYNYAKHRIPIVFFYDHMTEDYHRPTDDVEKINFEKIEKVATLITELGLRIANLDHKLKID